jgi:hypothetical protein
LKMATTGRLKVRLLLVRYHRNQHLKLFLICFN